MMQAIKLKKIENKGSQMGHTKKKKNFKPNLTPKTYQCHLFFLVIVPKLTLEVLEM